MTREEHMKWCKERALQYVNEGDVSGGYASMASDLSKHPGTAGHPAIMLGMMQMASGHLSDPNAMREFIEGFN